MLINKYNLLLLIEFSLFFDFVYVFLISNYFIYYLYWVKLLRIEFLNVLMMFDV